MYKHYRVNRMTNKARKLLKELFNEFFERPFLLPSYWQQKISCQSESNKANIITQGSLLTTLHR